jgi:hypothetical protein
MFRVLWIATCTEQSKGLSPEMWAQFMNASHAMMKGTMGSGPLKAQTVFTQMQEQNAK